MVYIDRNGRVLEKRPWDLNRIIEIFSSIWILVVYFFTTLFAPFQSDNQRGNRNNRRGGGGGGGGWGSGGGGGGRGSSSGNDGLRPNRRIGRITNSMDCNIPGGG